MLITLILAALFVAYANGANDNFKGVATLYGGRVLPYKAALSWATITTFAGALVSFFLGSQLLKLFTGKGIVSNAAVSDPAFVFSVAIAAALTVILATLFGFPISTTHSLVGGLVGAGIASRSILSFQALGKSFLLPLIAGPAVAIVVTACLYSFFHFARVRSGVKSTTCFCAGGQQQVLIGSPGLYTIQSSGVKVSVSDEQYCRKIYRAESIRWNLQKVMDVLHGISAGAVSFARGLNDTPKIAVLMVIAPLLSARMGLLLIALVMAIGGLVHSRKIAQTMSFGITDMNPGQAFTGNIVTAALVIVGSIYGFPLSTTHVSCGSIFGIGLTTKNIQMRTLLQIGIAWITTLPLAAALAALTWLLLHVPYFRS